MEETKKWIEKKIKFEKYSNFNRIMNTGFIFYKDINISQEICDQVYKACIDLVQPECQIIWAIISQKYNEKITRINWEELDIYWQEPGFYSFVIKCLKKFKSLWFKKFKLFLKILKIIKNILKNKFNHYL